MPLQNSSKFRDIDILMDKAKKLHADLKTLSRSLKLQQLSKSLEQNSVKACKNLKDVARELEDISEDLEGSDDEGQQPQPTIPREANAKQPTTLEEVPEVPKSDSSGGAQGQEEPIDNGSKIQPTQDSAISKDSKPLLTTGRSRIFFLGPDSRGKNRQASQKPLSLPRKPTLSKDNGGRYRSDQSGLKSSLNDNPAGKDDHKGAPEPKIRQPNLDTRDSQFTRDSQSPKLSEPENRQPNLDTRDSQSTRVSSPEPTEDKLSKFRELANEKKLIYDGDGVVSKEPEAKSNDQRAKRDRQESGKEKSATKKKKKSPKNWIKDKFNSLVSWVKPKSNKHQAQRTSTRAEMDKVSSSIPPGYESKSVSPDPPKRTTKNVDLQF